MVCRKQFAKIGAAEEDQKNLNQDWLIWINADVLLGESLPQPQVGPFYVLFRKAGMVLLRKLCRLGFKA